MCQALVSMQVFAPEAQWKLAGGVGFAKPPEALANDPQALKGRRVKPICLVHQDVES